MGGTGLGPSKDWMMGPNKAAYPQTQPGKQMPGLAGACHRRWQYTIRSSPFNGNHPSKPLVKWFKSWQVDGTTSLLYSNTNLRLTRDLEVSTEKPGRRSSLFQSRITNQKVQRQRQ